MVINLCRVCLNDGAALHYGGVVCGSCKIFFARTVQKRKIYVCDEDGKCNVITERRSKCRSCRYRACLSAGMISNEVGRLRELPITDELPEQLSVVPDMDFGKLKTTSLSPPETSFSVSLFEKKMPSSERVRLLTGLERFCDGDDICNSEESESTYSNLDVPIDKIYDDPENICKRTTMCWFDDNFSEYCSETIKTRYCRFMVHYTDFLRGCKELGELEEDDRTILYSKQMCLVMVVTVAYNRYKRFDFDGTTESIDDKDGMHHLTDRISDCLNKRIVRIFDEIKLSEEEYILLKMICVFHKTTGLSDSARCTVRSARHYYEQMLIDYVYETRKDLENKEKNTRLVILFGTVPHLMVVSKMVDQQFSRMVVANFAEMRGGLAFDVHLREKC